ncbi:hypothetical protein B7494_g3927 [Chlorociboria aeruginascens]|nr:hypothetical protein B7494_g3927 [Chlorociboria aeruginascens]
MPVTIKPAEHLARRWKGAEAAESAEDLLQASCNEEFQFCKQIIQSSFRNLDELSVRPSANGFVYAVVEAYSKHFNLIIRPDDVWFSILTQLSLYIDANAEETRDMFVDYEGQRRLDIEDVGSWDSFDFSVLAQRMTKLMEKNMVDEGLRYWIMPAFSTTSDTDRTVASIIMMGAMQKYMTYSFTLACGIPSVTLLGTKEDWEQLLEKIETLPGFGEESAQWYRLLRPVLARFVACFDAPESEESRDFWQSVAHHAKGRSGPNYLSGWITAFSFFDKNGRSMYGMDEPMERIMTVFEGPETPRLYLDGIPYHRVDSDQIPPGYSAVPATVNDSGDVYECLMVAGSVGIRVTTSGERLDEEDPNTPPAGRLEIMRQAGAGVTGQDSVQPESGWWIFEKKELPEEELARLSNPHRGVVSADDGMDHIIDVWAAEPHPPPWLPPAFFPVIAERRRQLLERVRQEQIFGGGGRRLGAASTQPAMAAPFPAELVTKPDASEIDESKLTIPIRIRLCDNSSLTSKFSPEQTIDDIYAFVNASNAASRERKWVLMTTFPSKKLDDRGAPLGEVEELRKGASVVQKWAS